MSDFERAVKTVLLHEGGFVDNKADPGGVTNHGISFRFLKDIKDLDLDGTLLADINNDGVIDAKDVKDMDIDNAKKFYKRYFWDKNLYEKILDQTLATKAFDFSVNMGAKQANKLLQRAANLAGGFKLIDDGVLGPKSFNAINSCCPIKLLLQLEELAVSYYTNLVAKNPKLSQFIKGWLNRARSTPL